MKLLCYFSYFFLSLNGSKLRNEENLMFLILWGMFSLVRAIIPEATFLWCRWENTVNTADVVINVWTDLIIIVGYRSVPSFFFSFGSKVFDLIFFLFSPHMWLFLMQWLNNCVGQKNYVTFISLMATSLIWVGIWFFFTSDSVEKFHFSDCIFM